ncbi:MULTISPECIES: ribosome silencing factor [unclassified Meiothermus]|uniref:ribosome silencing factor n=1 Tax=unclassified Meiothermus TaxID=370471 RepID=UPI000D7CA4BC|nr:MULTISPECIES: ribosome silencing factor [unclassified Meiothermus]PZA08947.1 ribosome silencing factor [Meiothermus sp. Pnk-1]RYM33690.1 ribosome silencing factor [Meiothermus sp. PNK-Is4]
MVKPVEAQTLISRIRQVLDDKKAENVVALDLRGASETLDYFVVASGTSRPHLEALERAVRESLEEQGIRPRHVEGPSPRWILLDYDEVLVHLMSPEAREFYDLEGFWADAKRI